jgi:hypothetical protein
MSFSGETPNARWPVVVCALLALVGVLRIISSYPLTSLTFDEPCHLAAAIELLARHTYKLDPVHPPLARIAIGLRLYLAGERYPKLSLPDQEITEHDVGNAILSDSGHYARNLALARMGVLPFFLLATAIIFLWARREYGNLAAVMAAAFVHNAAQCVGVFEHRLHRHRGRGHTTRIVFRFRPVARQTNETLGPMVRLGRGVGAALESHDCNFLSRGSLRHRFRKMDLHAHPRWRKSRTETARASPRGRRRDRHRHPLGLLWLCGRACQGGHERARRTLARCE